MSDEILHTPQPRLAALSELTQAWLGPFLVSLALVGLTTVALWYIDKWPNADGIVFIYFVPTTFVALCYGNTAAMIATIMSCLFGAYFIQPPTYTLAVANSIDVWDLVFFSLLAVLASRVVAGYEHDVSVMRRRRRSAIRRRPRLTERFRALLNRLRLPA